jgi:hypothetical protein
MTATLDDVLAALNQLNANLQATNPWDEQGTATGGSTTQLVDNSKNWASNFFFSSLVIVTIDGTTYRTFTTGNTSTQLNLYPALPTEIKPGSPYKVRNVTSQVASARARPGILLTANQTLKQFVNIMSNVTVWPYVYVPWFQPPIPPGGTCTAGPSITVMTNALVSFTPSALVGMTIFNISDGSNGLVLANDAHTVTSLPLSGGVANVWAIGNSYLFAGHLIDVGTGISLPYTVPAGSFLTVIEESWSFNQDENSFILVDGLFVASGGPLSGGTPYYDAGIVGESTLTLDPTASKSHQVDFIMINQGLSPMYGSGEIVAIQEIYTGST